MNFSYKIKTPTEIQTRETLEQDLKELIEECCRKFVNGISGIKEVTGVEMLNIEFNLENYKGQDYQFYFENLTGKNE